MPISIRPMASLRLALAGALAGLALWPADLAAEVPDVRPAVTVRGVLPGCRALVAMQGLALSPEAAFCNGLVDSLLYLGEMLPADFCYAVPADEPRYRVVQAIVEEIEPIYPSVEQQHFRALALDVLQFKWPCRYN